MVRAIWNGTVIAESEKTIELEGNHHFPPGSVNQEYLEFSNTTSECPWKGRRTVLHLVRQREEE